MRGVPAPSRRITGVIEHGGEQGLELIPLPAIQKRIVVVRERHAGDRATRQGALAREMFENWVAEGVDRAEEHAQQTAQDGSGREPAEQEPTRPQGGERAQRDAQVREQYGGNQAPPGIDLRSSG